MIALSDIIILTVSGALLVVALMRAYSPDNTDVQQNPVGQVQQQPAAASTPAQSNQGQSNQGQSNQGQATQAQASQEQSNNPAAISGNGTAPTDNTQTATSGLSQAQQPAAETPTPTPEIVLESYTVQSGDSLSLIASRTGSSVQELQAINRLNSTVIQIGQVLRYPAP